MVTEACIPELPKRYCSKCGKLMISVGKMRIKKDDGMWGSYDSETGKIPTYYFQEVKCPDRKWYNGHAYGELSYNSEQPEKGWW